MKGSSIFYRVRSHRRSSSPKCSGFNRQAFLLILFVLGLASGWINLGAAATLSSAAHPIQTTAYLLKNTSITGDFDNDNQPDLAIIRSEGSNYKIEIQLSARQKRLSYTVPSSALSITLIVCDVDGDDDDDLVILNGTSLQPLGAWLNNDGQGRFETGDDLANSNAIWSDNRFGYQHHSDWADQVFISQNTRLPFDRSAWGLLSTSVEPEGFIPGELQKGSLQILTYARQGRSPPLPSLIRT